MFKPPVTSINLGSRSSKVSVDSLLKHFNNAVKNADYNTALKLAQEPLFMSSPGTLFAIIYALNSVPKSLASAKAGLNFCLAMRYYKDDKINEALTCCLDVLLSGVGSLGSFDFKLAKKTLDTYVKSNPAALKDLSFHANVSAFYAAGYRQGVFGEVSIELAKKHYALFLSRSSELTLSNCSTFIRAASLFIGIDDETLAEQLINVLQSISNKFLKKRAPSLEKARIDFLLGRLFQCKKMYGNSVVSYTQAAISTLSYADFSCKEGAAPGPALSINASKFIRSVFELFGFSSVAESFVELLKAEKSLGQSSFGHDINFLLGLVFQYSNGLSNAAQQEANKYYRQLIGHHTKMYSIYYYELAKSSTLPLIKYDYYCYLLKSGNLEGAEDYLSTIMDILDPAQLYSATFAFIKARDEVPANRTAVKYRRVEFACLFRIIWKLWAKQSCDECKNSFDYLKRNFTNQNLVVARLLVSFVDGIEAQDVKKIEFLKYVLKIISPARAFSFPKLRSVSRRFSDSGSLSKSSSAGQIQKVESAKMLIKQKIKALEEPSQGVTCTTRSG